MGITTLSGPSHLPHRPHSLHRHGIFSSHGTSTHADLEQLFAPRKIENTVVPQKTDPVTAVAVSNDDASDVRIPSTAMHIYHDPDGTHVIPGDRFAELLPNLMVPRKVETPKLNS